MTKKQRTKVRDIVTEKILSMLKEGTVPWRRPWKMIGRARNLVSKKAYRGINVWLLAGSQYSSPWWVTYRQAQKLGGQVRKGEKGTMIVFWKWREIETENDDGETEMKRIPLMRYYTVFNVEQCDGLEDKVPAEEVKDIDPIEAAEQIIASMPKRPPIKHGGDRAFYRPLEDVVGMPERNQFHSGEGYYATAFHELIHATGHEARLGRFDSRDIRNAVFGSKSYSEEELVAEMGAAFLMAETGIEMELDNSAAYIQSWIKQLENDHNLVIVAAQAAQKAADFILDVKVDAKVEITKAA